MRLGCGAELGGGSVKGGGGRRSSERGGVGGDGGLPDGFGGGGSEGWGGRRSRCKREIAALRAGAGRATVGKLDDQPEEDFPLRLGGVALEAGPRLKIVT